MEKGKILNIKIEDMSNEGQGIGKADGLVVFVPDTIVGEEIRVELTKVKSRYAFGRVTEVLEESQFRSAEYCPYIDEGCGGCPYGKIDYSKQLEIKERQVREKLERLGDLQVPRVNEIISMAPEDNDDNGCYRYRNKATFPVSTGGIITRKGGIVENLGEPAVGFYEAGSHRVVNCEDCYLQSMAAMAAADALRRFMEEDNITAWDPKWEKGLMRHLIVKTGFNTGQVMVVLVINGKGIPNGEKLVSMLDDAIYDVGYSLESVVVSMKKADAPKAGNGRKSSAGKYHRQGKEQILGDSSFVLAGNPVIKDVLGELELEISAESFYQVNPVQMERLYDKVREYCLMDAGSKKPVVLDLYCGVGTIGLYCSDIADYIVGIESIKSAVTDANRNAVINGIVNARYICGKAEDVLRECMSDDDSVAEATTDDRRAFVAPELRDKIMNCDIAILDPPRAGCRPELLEAVAATGVKKIIYVSCDPATLARDIKLLEALGFSYCEATPVDMFPGTGHVETVCLLSKLNTKQHIEVDLDLDELDATSAETKATYNEIQQYVLKETGLMVSNLYIAQVKKKCGINVGESFNKPKSENAKQPKCPAEKEKAIRDALKHFGMI